MNKDVHVRKATQLNSTELNSTQLDVELSTRSQREQLSPINERSDPVDSVCRSWRHKQKHDWLGCTLCSTGSVEFSLVQLRWVKLCRYEHPLTQILFLLCILTRFSPAMQPRSPRQRRSLGGVWALWAQSGLFCVWFVEFCIFFMATAWRWNKMTYKFFM